MIISEGIGGTIFSKNIAKQIVRYATVEFFSTAKLIYSGIEVRKFKKIKLKFNICKAQIYMALQQIR